MILNVILGNPHTILYRTYLYFSIGYAAGEFLEGTVISPLHVRREEAGRQLARAGVVGDAFATDPVARAWRIRTRAAFVVLVRSAIHFGLVLLFINGKQIQKKSRIFQGTLGLEGLFPKSYYHLEW